MIFNQTDNQVYECMTWNVGLENIEDVKCGELRHGPEPYFYFFPTSGIPLACGDVRVIMEQLRDLNDGLAISP